MSYNYDVFPMLSSAQRQIITQCHHKTKLCLKAISIDIIYDKDKVLE